MQREAHLESLRKGELYDLLVIGGGATGCGVALDAASRGLKVALAERGDFGSGTSGRSTKLVHGGVRYLEAAVTSLDRVQFNLVRDALHERGILLRIAPHLCHRIPLAVPIYRDTEVPYLWAGLKLYDLLAGSLGLGASSFIGREETLARFPMVKAERLKGAVLYWDGQFNDARMNLALALSAAEQGAVLANHLEVVRLVRERERVAGAQLRERFTGESFEVRARCLVNAGGPWADGVRSLDDPGAPPLLSVSSGSHIVLPRRFAPREGGITIPRTEDGRVLFILPWLGGCLVGTTDHPARPGADPRASREDVEYLLRHLERYFGLKPDPAQIRAAWCGLRPLVRDPRQSDTARLARDHVVSASPSGLVTVVGGKWTTYRKMARDTVDFAVRSAGLRPERSCRTEELTLAGGEGFRPDGGRALAAQHALEPDVAEHLQANYGSRAAEVALLCRGELAGRLVPGHPYLKGEVPYAVRQEWARSAEDFLARRIPLALLDYAAAGEAAPAVLELMGRELSWDAGRRAREQKELQRWVEPPL